MQRTVMVGLVSALALNLLFGAPCLACSGPGAIELMMQNERFGAVAWMVGLAISVWGSVIALRRPRESWWMFVLAALVVVHPGWWLGVHSGDCGFMVRDGSVAVLVAQLAVAVAAYARRRRVSAQTA